MKNIIKNVLCKHGCIETRETLSQYDMENARIDCHYSSLYLVLKKE